MKRQKDRFSDLKIEDQRAFDPSLLYRLLGLGQPAGYEAEAIINLIDPEDVPAPPPKRRPIRTFNRRAYSTLDEYLSR